MINLREEPVADLRQHAGIPSVVESQVVYDVSHDASAVRLAERRLTEPFRKNYDQLEDPLRWSHQLRHSEAALIAAFSCCQRIGGVIVVAAMPGLVDWLNDPAVAVVWDIRIAVAHRRQSVATSLLHAAQAWADKRGCGELAVETQNTNLAACRLYMRNGFVLHKARRGTYPEVPEEVQLIWRKKLDG